MQQSKIQSYDFLLCGMGIFALSSAFVNLALIWFPASSIRINRSPSMYPRGTGLFEDLLLDDLLDDRVGAAVKRLLVSLLLFEGCPPPRSVTRPDGETQRDTRSKVDWNGVEPDDSIEELELTVEVGYCSSMFPSFIL